MTAFPASSKTLTTLLALNVRSVQPDESSTAKSAAVIIVSTENFKAPAMCRVQSVQLAARENGLIALPPIVLAVLLGSIKLSPLVTQPCAAPAEKVVHHQASRRSATTAKAASFRT